MLWQVHVLACKWRRIHAHRVELVGTAFLVLLAVIVRTEPPAPVALANIAVKDSGCLGLVELTVEEALTLLDRYTSIAVVEHVTSWALASGDAHVLALGLGL